MNVTRVFHNNLEAYNARKRIIANKGSARSSKTYSILQLLYIIAETSAKPRIISIDAQRYVALNKLLERNATLSYAVIGRRK